MYFYSFKSADLSRCVMIKAYSTSCHFFCQKQHFSGGNYNPRKKKIVWWKHSGRISLPEGWNWDLSVEPPVSPRHTKARTHFQVFTHILFKCLCTFIHTHVDINIPEDIYYMFECTHCLICHTQIYTVHSQSLTQTHNSSRISFFAALLECPWSARIAPRSVIWRADICTCYSFTLMRNCDATTSSSFLCGCKSKKKYAA